jgi:hypothetical protein
LAPASTDDELNLIAAGQLAHAGEDSITLSEPQQTETRPKALLSQKQK